MKRGMILSRELNHLEMTSSGVNRQAKVNESIHGNAICLPHSHVHRINQLWSSASQIQADNENTGVTLWGNKGKEFGIKLMYNSLTGVE